MNMRKIADIHVFEDQAFLHAIKRESLMVCIGGAIVAALWAMLMLVLREQIAAPVVPFELGDVLGTLGLRLMGLEGEAMPSVAWWLSLSLGCLLTLAIHEGVHAFFFKQYAPAGTHVHFGAHAQTGMLYASAEGVVYPRAQYMVIALAPSVVVTLLVLAVGIGLSWPLWTIILGTAHLSGCTGDWGYVHALRRNPDITHCRDTSFGVEFYADDDAEDSAEGFAKEIASVITPAQGSLQVVDGGKK